MKVELIIIGNELLNGKIQDTNTKCLATLCHQEHIELTKVHIIQDNAKDFNLALKQAYHKADIIITSGGLGPTKDDLTKDMLSTFFNAPLEKSNDALKVISKQYQDKNKEYLLKINYHFIPQGFKAIYNEIGFAPGLLFKKDQKYICALPGVPSEFQEMLTKEIFPSLLEEIKLQRVQKHVIIKTYKVPEAQIFYNLAPKLWDKLTLFGEVSSLPHSYGVDIGVKIQAKTLKELESIEKEIINLIKETPIKEYIWHIGPESLEEIIVKEAQEKKLLIAMSESCTGGLCAHRITNISGCSSIFLGSIISYANSAKENILNVQTKTLIDHGAVSLECAKEMACGARNTLKADIAISTTGIAGPLGGSEEKPVGTVGIGFSDIFQNDSKIYKLNGNRDQLKQRFSQVALFTLLERIRAH